jgi:hypothetical protein
MVDVPPSNDEASFYRAIAEAVGLGNYLNYKNVQIKERVEFVLREGGIFLVLNHAERLWPQKNLREAFPGRLAWLLDQVANGAAVCLISGPQFFMQQRACEKTGWNSPELQMQIANTVQLPASLSVEDVTAIARIALPGLTEKFLSAVAVVAVSSKRYLASIEAIVKRAQYIAKQNGRQQCDTKDITAAISFVNQSDNLLRNLLSGTQKIAPTRPITAEPPATTHSRLPERESNPAGLVPTPAVNRRSDSDAETSSSCKRNSIDLIKG